MKKLIGLLIICQTLSFAQFVDFSFRTVTYNGQFKPDHCLAVWVTDDQNAFVQTLYVKAGFPHYANSLCQWIAHSNYEHTDAVTGATEPAHTTHNALWDCRDTGGSVITDGTYRVWVEFTESNPCTSKSAYYQFTKGGTIQNLTFTDKTYFKNVTLFYHPDYPGHIQFAEPRYTVNEDAGSLQMTVNRDYGDSGAVTVSYTSSGITAAAGSDFTGISGTLSWSDGDRSARTVALPVTDDTGYEISELLSVNLSVTGGKAVTGLNDPAVIAILDDEAAVTESGLAGYWDMNEGTGSAAFDLSGNGGHGIIDGAVWATGKIGKALDFSGSDRLTLGTGNALDLNGPITVSAWVYPRARNVAMTLVVKSGKYTLWIQSNNEVRFADARGHYVDTPANLLPLNTWTHVAAVFTGTRGTGVNSSTAKIYINGVSRGSQYSGTWDPDTTNNTVFAGPSGYNGLLDDVRIYNRALSAAEAAALYNWTGASNQPPAADAGTDTVLVLPVSSSVLAGSGTDTDGSVVSYAWTQVSGPGNAVINDTAAAITPVSGLTGRTYVFRLAVTDNRGSTDTDDVTVQVLAADPATLDSGLAAHWQFEEGSGTGTADASGNGNIGTLNGATWTAGMFGSGLSFNGTSAQVTVNLDASLDLTGPVSVSAWVYPAVNNQDMCFLWAGNQYIFWVQSNNELRYADVHGNYVDSPAGVLTLNAWNHVVGVFGGGSGTAVSTGNAKIYLNGALLSGQVSGTWSPAATPATGVFIGSNGGNSNYWNGRLDEIRVYGRELNAAEVMLLADTTRPNVPPVADAGADTAITMPPNSLTLHGSGADGDGTVAAYAWAQVSGPGGAALVSPDKADCPVSGLVEGMYVFELTVTDDDGAADRDSVTVTAADAPAPGTDAGPDTLLMTISRQSHYEWSDQSYKPYAVWWVEDGSGELVKVLYMTFFDDSIAGTKAYCGITSFSFALSYFYDRFGSAGCPYKNGEQCSVCPACPGDYDMVDGISGCSEPSSTIDSTSITRMWDLTDRDGNRVPAGTYHLYYSAVFIDEEQPRMDKVFGVSLDLGSTARETLVTSPADLAGTSTDASFVMNAIRVSYGGSDKLGTNRAPAVYAGGDTTVYLPVTSVTLNGTATDTDGSIVSTVWSQYAGPGTAVIGSPGALGTSVGNLSEGVWVFRLTVTDNLGAVRTAEVTVTVTSSTGHTDITAVHRPADGLIRVTGHPSKGAVGLILFIPTSRTGTDASLTIYGPEGRCSELFKGEYRAAGEKRYRWSGIFDDGTTAGSGMYFVRLQIGNEVFTQKLMYLE